jgi:hypothetical protein
VWTIFTAVVFDNRVLSEVGAKLDSKLNLPGIVTENIKSINNSVQIPVWIRFGFWGMASVFLFIKPYMHNSHPTPTKRNQSIESIVIAQKMARKMKKMAQKIISTPDRSREQTYPLFKCEWLVNDDTPQGRATQLSQRQASCLGILPNTGTGERIIGEALSTSDKRKARWVCKTDEDSEIISPQEASIFLEEINQYGCTVAVKRGRGDIVYGRIESNEMMQRVEHWDANYVIKWMLSTDLVHHKELVDAVAGRRMSTLLNRIDLDAVLDVKDVSNNAVIRNPLYDALKDQFQYELIEPSNLLEKMPKALSKHTRLDNILTKENFYYSNILFIYLLFNLYIYFLLSWSAEVNILDSMKT